MQLYKSFSDIPQFGRAKYNVAIDLTYLLHMIDDYAKEYDLDMDPDFQRGHVWTTEQRERYVEFLLRGGQSGRDIYLNCPGFETDSTPGQMVLVDGKQRLTSCLMFLRNEVKAFGAYYREYEGSIRNIVQLKIHVNQLRTRAEVLSWYLDLNAGGTVHTDEEIARVRELLAGEHTTVGTK